eukprot:TRINITY_DN18864_c0_g1_i1.p1 TRINITY_DN18864_c0_g1~~TRINITY_DN18864_c0_g1_i1.p1  ORF type:complete len:568 (+),score=110.31 TRINITY_DN18864_c0_g1_i1:67-1770(+)
MCIRDRIRGIESMERYAVNILEHSHFLLCLVLSALNSDRPADLLKDPNSHIRTISEKMPALPSKILTNLKNEETKERSKGRPDECLRRAGCRCLQCEPVLQEAVNAEAPKTPLEFSKAPLEMQYRLMAEAPMEFKSFYDKILTGDSLNFAQSLEEESFLNALNRIVLTEHKENVVRTLTRSHTFWNMLLLAVGYSDNMRWRALQLMIHLAHPGSSSLPEVKVLPYPMEDEEARKLSDKVYTQRYDIDYWIGVLSDITFKTKIVPLSLPDMEVLKKLCEIAKSHYMSHVNQCLKTPNGIKMPTSWLNHLLKDHRVTSTDRQIIEETCARLEITSSAFIKLSSRSPKDSFLLPHRERAILKHLLAKGTERAEELAEAESMRVSNGREGMEVLLMSQRVEDDLESMLEWSKSLCTAESRLKVPMSLVVREWKKIPKWGEFRGFVCKSRLNAVTQYFCDFMFPQFIKKKEIESMIQNFFDKLVKSRLELLKLPHAVVDFGITLNESNEIDKVIVLELNSFGVRSGSGLFDWDKEEDLRIMLNGPFTFRVVEKSKEQEAKAYFTTCQCVIEV